MDASGKARLSCTALKAAPFLNASCTIFDEALRQLDTVMIVMWPHRHCEEQGDEAIQPHPGLPGLLRFARHDGRLELKPSRSSAPEAQG
jgi:hypothetical protein